MTIIVKVDEIFPISEFRSQKKKQTTDRNQYSVCDRTEFSRLASAKFRQFGVQHAELNDLY